MRLSNRRHRQCDQHRNWTFHGFAPLVWNSVSISFGRAHGDGGHISSQDTLGLPDGKRQIRIRENAMVARALTASFGAAFSLALVLASLPSAQAEDLLKVAVAQRGQWDTAITELGERSGIFKRRGIAVEVLYTQGGPEAHQAVISGSMDIACGGGIESAIGGFSKGAPVRVIGSAMIGSPDTYWFVVANSPIKSLADASGKTISYSQNGSSRPPG